MHVCHERLKIRVSVVQFHPWSSPAAPVYETAQAFNYRLNLVRMTPRTVRDVIGNPESWPNYRYGGTRMPRLRGAKIVSVRPVDPDELQVTIEAHGQTLASTFVLEDRDLRLRVQALLVPGTELTAALDQEL